MQANRNMQNNFYPPAHFDFMKSILFLYCQNLCSVSNLKSNFDAQPQKEDSYEPSRF